MEFVTIGNPGNAADENGYPRPAGAVGYTYGIGKFEVSRDMITKFNASQSLKITLADLNLYGGNGIQFIYDAFQDTHDVIKLNNHQGYIVLTPKEI